MRFCFAIKLDAAATKGQFICGLDQAKVAIFT